MKTLYFGMFSMTLGITPALSTLPDISIEDVAFNENVHKSDAGHCRSLSQVMQSSSHIPAMQGNAPGKSALSLLCDEQTDDMEDDETPGLPQLIEFDGIYSDSKHHNASDEPLTPNSLSQVSFERRYYKREDGPGLKPISASYGQFHDSTPTTVASSSQQKLAPSTSQHASNGKPHYQAPVWFLYATPFCFAPEFRAMIMSPSKQVCSIESTAHIPPSDDEAPLEVMENSANWTSFQPGSPPHSQNANPSSERETSSQAAYQGNVKPHIPSKRLKKWCKSQRRMRSVKHTLHVYDPENHTVDLITTTQSINTITQKKRIPLNKYLNTLN